MKYLRNRGGTQSAVLSLLAVKIWNIFLDHTIVPCFRHVSTTANYDADSLSRGRSTSIEWTFLPYIYDKIFEYFGLPSICLLYTSPSPRDA